MNYWYTDDPKSKKRLCRLCNGHAGRGKLSAVESSRSTSDAVTGQCSPGRSERGRFEREGEMNGQSRGACRNCRAGGKVALHGRSGETGVYNEVRRKERKRW